MSRTCPGHFQLSPAVSRKFPQVSSMVQQSAANSRKVPQSPAMLDVRDVRDMLDHLRDTHTRDRTSHDSTKKEKKVGDFESARPHYCFFQGPTGPEAGTSHSRSRSATHSHSPQPLAGFILFISRLRAERRNTSIPLLHILTRTFKIDNGETGVKRLYA
jgi:hypothetical protein